MTTRPLDGLAVPPIGITSPPVPLPDLAVILIGIAVGAALLFWAVDFLRLTNEGIDR